MHFGSLMARIRSYDWTLIVVVHILMAIGFAAIYSVDLSRGEQLRFFPTQIVAFAIGIFVLAVAARTQVSFYQASARAVYIGAGLLLLAVLFFGVTIRGTTGWFRLAGFSFQPAELAKVGLIMALAAVIERQGRRFDRPQFLVRTGIMMALYVAFILLQPDLGSALVLGALWFGLLLLSGTKKRYIALLVGLGAAASIFAWFFLLKGYQKERITTFLHPEAQPLDAGYNVTQSIIAIGAGEWFGRGLGFGSQSQLHFLPEAQTDFIFAVIAEELGFVGASAVLVLYGLIIWRLLLIARRCRNDFGAYAVTGMSVLLVVQVVANIGAATGMLPVTGLTLPFVSYGGSSLIINLLLIGIAESVARSNWEHEDTVVVYG